MQLLAEGVITPYSGGRDGRVLGGWMAEAKGPAPSLLISTARPAGLCVACLARRPCPPWMPSLGKHTQVLGLLPMHSDTSHPCTLLLPTTALAAPGCTPPTPTPAPLPAAVAAPGGQGLQGDNNAPSDCPYPRHPATLPPTAGHCGMRHRIAVDREAGTVKETPAKTRHLPLLYCPGRCRDALPAGTGGGGHPGDTGAQEGREVLPGGLSRSGADAGQTWRAKAGRQAGIRVCRTRTHQLAHLKGHARLQISSSGALPNTLPAVQADPSRLPPGLVPAGTWPPLS